MNLVFWISLGIFIVSTVLYFVFYKLNITVPKRVFAFLICPLLAVVSISSLYNFTPDSLHVILITVISFLLCSISVIFFFFDSNVKFRVIGRTAFLLSLFFWFLLYKSTFYIYKVSPLISIIFSLVYAGLLVFTFILLGKQKVSRYFWTFISVLLCSMLHFCSTVTLIEGHSLYSIFLFLGTTVIFVLVINQLSFYKKEPRKHAKLLQFCMLFGSQLLIATANFLMLM